MPALFRIRRAWPHEAFAISALALRSKAHWGYSAEEMRVFAGELRLDPEVVRPRRAHVAESGGRLAGFYTLRATAPGELEGDVELEHLFVDPGFMGRGLGSELLRHARAVARRAGYGRMVVQSDPNAAGFYHVRGAALVRLVPSSLPGRSLPLLEIRL